MDDLGICTRSCQCDRYKDYISAFQPYFPGILPPANYRGIKKEFLYQEYKFVKDPTSECLQLYKAWMPVYVQDFPFKRDDKSVKCGLLTSEALNQTPYIL